MLAKDPADINSCRAQIERNLKEVLGCDRQSSSQSRLRKAICLAVLSGGNRIRPMLAILSCVSLGGRVADAVPLASAIELVHASSLVFDDLPAMDDESKRRSRPALHRKEGEAIAMLAAISLLARAFEITGAFDAKHGTVATLCVAKTIGENGMCGGQFMDLVFQSRRDLSAQSREQIERLCIDKTGLLMATACDLGAMAAGAGSAERQALYEYGLRLGLAYQIMDDVGDMTSDARKWRPNYAAVSGPQCAERRAVALLDEARQQSKLLGIDTDPLDNYAQTLIKCSPALIQPENDCQDS